MKIVFSQIPMVDTFYLHLQFRDKKGGWSINLPFLCNRCGVCCVLEDFLMAGEITAKPKEHPQVHAKVKALFDEIGKIWQADEAKYDNYIAHTPCPFLVNNDCSIYEFRPLGCRLFPNTTFGMLTQDCSSLTRFKKQRTALKKGKSNKESYHFVGKTVGSTKNDESVKSAKFTEKQYQTCIGKLCQAGITDDELSLFHYFNAKK